jgi:predicted enzyme related to lactoylglutathione lyase
VHRSRLASFWIDVPAELFDVTCRFWRDGLGYAGRDSTAFPGTFYMLGTWSEFDLGVQRIGSGAVRWHLDVVSDDLDESIARVVAAGAAVDELFDGWARLIDPAGMPFCVVPGTSSGVYLDLPTDEFGTGAAFWAAALGRYLVPEDGEPDYFALGRLGAKVTVGIQRLGTGAPRWHVDIESDDVEAEVCRLEGLGASRVELIETWWTICDPVGQTFCVTQVQTDGFDDATDWR